MDNSTAHVTLASLSADVRAIVAALSPRTVSVFARNGRPSNGFFFDRGLVLTPAHAVQRDHDLSIRTADGVRHAAVLAGRDTTTNVAVLRVDTVPEVSASESIDIEHPGSVVLALARHPLGSPLVAMCLVEGVVRPMKAWRGQAWERVVRLDRGLPPAFAGAPLIDAAGRLAGMVLAGDLRSAGLAAGAVGVMDVARTLVREGGIRRGYLGVMCQAVRLAAAQADAARVSSGLLVVGLADGASAATSGVLVGDVLLRFDDDPTENVEDLHGRLSRERAGTAHRLTVLRGTNVVTLETTLGTREERG
jgi:S1-C subfamily serine protease